MCLNYLDRGYQGLHEKQANKKQKTRTTIHARTGAHTHADINYKKQHYNLSLWYLSYLVVTYQLTSFIIFSFTVFILKSTWRLISWYSIIYEWNTMSSCQKLQVLEKMTYNYWQDSKNKQLCVSYNRLLADVSAKVVWMITWQWY